jgi:hypothetical protein
MYKPVIPPADHNSPATGNGSIGYNSAAANNTTAQGVRHNGALTVQIIKATTPASAIQQVISGHPEYGWRVTSAEFKNYVLGEYTLFWHYRKGMTSPPEQCYGDAQWTKLAVLDVRTCGATDNNTTTKCATNKDASDGTDPKIGALSAIPSGAGTLTGTTSTPVTNGTQTVYSYTGGFTRTVTRTIDPTTGVTTIVTVDRNSAGVVTSTKTDTIASTAGANKSGGDERGSQARTGRISWHEVVAP